MIIKASQVARTLTGKQLPIYWLSGDEPLQLQETADLIRKHFRSLGFNDREIFNVDKSFDWDQFTFATSNLSLFATRKILDMRLGSAKLEEEAKQAIQRFLDQPEPDSVLLISSPRLESATLKAKWFKRMEEAGAVVQIWPLLKEDLRDWMERRLLREGIQAEPAALSMLIDKVEGNLLAAVQEIEKIKLFANSADGAAVKLNADMVTQLVADSSRYTAFQLVDAALGGDAARAQKILDGLKNEGIFPLVVLGAVTRELHTLLPMLLAKEQGQAVAGIVQSAQIFFNRKRNVTTALQRLSTDKIWNLLNHARLIDQSIKGIAFANPWDELSSLLLALSGVTTATSRNELQPI